MTSAVFGAGGFLNTERVDRTYDDASRVTSETVFGDGPATFVSTFVRDQRGHPTAVTDPRGYVSGGPPDPAYTTTLVTDAAGRSSRQFLGTGSNPGHSRAVLVSTLAAARRSVAAIREEDGSIEGWLAEVQRIRGVRENAAYLAAMEVPDFRDEAIEKYLDRYPARTAVLHAICDLI